MLRKLLIANRGEIAVRIIRTARSLGYRTVAVYSEADALALHVQEADEAVAIGPARVDQSYLNGKAILEAAVRSGADCIHPGYGFLSENAKFARACRRAGLVFVGPPADAIELMGSKRRSKQAMQEAGLTVVPGFEGDNPDDATLLKAAKALEYPLMIKASAGGGGRGMRLVRESSDLPEALKRARSEALSSFGDDELILEKALVEPRHIEIQVFADSHGNAVYLGERDCSIQRRHQKVVEEAPSPFVDDSLRNAMGEAAVRAALACGYQGAGTVEFLVDRARNFYFLEMNTRLQVEHPVTELITGLDLVAWQLAVAEGQTLPSGQDSLSIKGHAIEARLYAEDPAEDFLPQTGTLHKLDFAETQGVRIDTGVRTGDVISPYYDPLLAKLIAWGETRDDARRRLLRSLEDSVIFGVVTNRAFLAAIVASEAFGKGQATTGFLDTTVAESPPGRDQPVDLRELTVAAAIVCGGRQPRQGWSNAPATTTPLSLQGGDHTYALQVRERAGQVFVTHRDRTHSIGVIRRSGHSLLFTDNGVRRVCPYHWHHNSLYLQPFSQTLHLQDLTHEAGETDKRPGQDRVMASMDGEVVDVRAERGQNVRQGELLVVLDAMKMEHPLRAPRDGQVASVSVARGDQVSRHQCLVELVPEDSAEASVSR